MHRILQTGLVALICGCGATAQAEIAVSRRAVTVTIPDQTLTISRDDATLRLAASGASCSLSPTLQLNQGWTTPQPARQVDPPQREHNIERVRIIYPVPQDREFHLLVEVYEGVPAFFITSKLYELKLTRPHYYFWQSSLTSDSYWSPGPAGPAQTAIDTTQSVPIDWAEWMFLPSPPGGIALMPTNCVGRAGAVFLHALPRSNVLSPGESLDASFGLSWCKNPERAAALAAQAHRLGRSVPSVSPTTSRPAASSRPARAWLHETGTYNLYYRPAAQWTGQIIKEKLTRFPLIIGSTPDRAALDKCHAAGVRLLHYVIYTCLLDTELQVREGGQVYSEWRDSLDNESRDLKNHPDWVCVQPDGRIRHDPWGMTHGHKGLLNTCLHQPGLQEAALRQVRMLMESGFDGVFIDLAGPVEECAGHTLGKHTHPNPEQTNTQAYERLLQRIFDTVKSVGPDRIVVQNTCTYMSPQRWPMTDAQMLEAFPFGSESTRMLATWPEMRWFAAIHQPYATQGKAPVLLSYFNKFDATGVREPALFSYAYARMYDLLWADGLTISEIKDAGPFAHALYSARLGRPVGDVQRIGAIEYRRFEHGLAILNPHPWNTTVQIPTSGPAPLTDLGYDGQLEPRNGEIKLELAPRSGRVLISGHPPR